MSVGNLSAPVASPAKRARVQPKARPLAGPGKPASPFVPGVCWMDSKFGRPATESVRCGARFENGRPICELFGLAKDIAEAAERGNGFSRPSPADLTYLDAVSRSLGCFTSRFCST